MILPDIFLEIEPIGVESVIKLVIVGLAVVLFCLSITAYRDIKIKRILFAAAAFGLFAVQFFVDFISDYTFLEEGVTDIIVLAIPLVILVLFFVSVVKQK